MSTPGTACRALIGSSVFRDLLGSFSKKHSVVRPSREEMAGRKLAEFREDRCSLWQSDPGCEISDRPCKISEIVPEPETKFLWQRASDYLDYAHQMGAASRMHQRLPKLMSAVREVEHHQRKLAQLGIDISVLQLPEPTPADLRRSGQLRPPWIGPRD